MLWRRDRVRTLERVWSPSRSEGKQWFVGKRQTREQWNASAYILVRDRKSKRFRYQGKGAANMLIVHNRPPYPLNGYQTHQTRVWLPSRRMVLLLYFTCFRVLSSLAIFLHFQLPFQFPVPMHFAETQCFDRGGWVLGLVYCLQGTTPSPAQEANGKSKKCIIGFFQIGKSFGLQLQSQNQSNFYMLRDGTS